MRARIHGTHLESRVVRLPNLQRYGLGNVRSLENVRRWTTLLVLRSLCVEVERKRHDHWPLGDGRNSSAEAFPTYPNGFPQSILDRSSLRLEFRILGNFAASALKLSKIGRRTLHDRQAIVYTSADSVFQIAAHEEIIPLEKLYEIAKPRAHTRWRTKSVA